MYLLSLLLLIDNQSHHVTDFKDQNLLQYALGVQYFPLAG